MEPDHDEMHPSRAHHSVTKKPTETELDLGFADISEGRRISINATQSTPTKSVSSLPAKLTSPGFEFQFASDAHLSSEAKKLMDNVREEAARIKAQMVAERNEQDRKDGETEKIFSGAGRKIATPKGKAGRFSDVHMAQFRKMDSIANHASSFRAQPSTLQSPNKSLKRSNSKAGLDEPERPGTAGRDTASKSTASVRAPASSSPIKSNASFGNEVGGFSKRLRQLQSDDVSTSHPVSRDGQADTHPSTLPRVKSAFLSTLATPTKASLARSAAAETSTPPTLKVSALSRSASVKQSRTAEHKLPSLTYSPSGRSISTTSKVEIHSKLPTLTGLKSILRRHQPLFSDDPVKIAAGTHVASPRGLADLRNTILDASAPSTNVPPTKSPKKHVAFTPSTKARYELTATSPSPAKALGVSPCSSPPIDPADIVYPELPTIGTPPSANEDALEATAGVGKPREIKGYKSIFAKLSSPTIRRVRESGVMTPVKPFEDLPAISHGLSNKKRHRDSSPSDTSKDKSIMGGAVSGEDVENKVPGRYPVDSDEPSSKRHKAEPAPSPEKRDVQEAIKRPIQRSGGDAARARKSKGVLSMARLNMLSRPKDRR